MTRSPDVRFDGDARTRPVGTAGRSWRERFSNNWPVVPMRIFLGALFLFAAYAKFSYGGFFDDNSPSGLKQVITRVKPDSPIRSLLQPLIDHASLLGHVTAGAEIAIGLGLIVGLLTRIAALGGIVLTTIIALSWNWGQIKEYTATSGWFTSVDIAVAVALTVFVLGGAGPLSLDQLVRYLRLRGEARDANEPSFTDTDPGAARQRLQDTGVTPVDSYATQTFPTQTFAAPTFSGPAAPTSAGPAAPISTGPDAPTYRESAAPTYPAPGQNESHPTTALPRVQPTQEPPVRADMQDPAGPEPLDPPRSGYPQPDPELDHHDHAEVEAEPRGDVTAEQPPVPPAPPTDSQQR